MKAFAIISLSSLMLTALMLLLSIPVRAQDYQQMRQELIEKQQNARTTIEALQRQIRSYEQLISETEDKYTRLSREHQNLEREIALRTEVIGQISEESEQLERHIELNRQSINELTEELEELVDNYQKTLTYMYKHGRTPDIALILTAHSFNQMLIRSYYLKKFEQYRKNQTDRILDARTALEARKEELLDSRNRNEALLAEKRSEQQNLQRAIARQQDNIESTRLDRQTAVEKLSARESELSELENTLLALIEEEARIREAESARFRMIEIERRRRLAQAELAGDEAAIARYSAPARAASIPSEEELSDMENSFSRSKGNLPWPVDHGAISARFGNKVNPIYGTEVNNPGVEIATEAHSTVKVIHDGYVYDVRPLPGFGTCVFVSHGRYITVYGNLSEVRVRRHMNLKAGDVIGLSGDDNSLKGQALFFMISEGSNYLDPEQWITRN